MLWHYITTVKTHMRLLSLLLSGGSSLLCGDALSEYLGNANQQSSLSSEILLWFPRFTSREEKDHRSRCSSHLEDKQVQVFNTQRNYTWHQLYVLQVFIMTKNNINIHVVNHTIKHDVCPPIQQLNTGWTDFFFPFTHLFLCIIDISYSVCAQNQAVFVRCSQFSCKTHLLH